jgi:hypothetical protein
MTYEEGLVTRISYQSKKFFLRTKISVRNKKKDVTSKKKRRDKQKKKKKGLSLLKKVSNQV